MLSRRAVLLSSAAALGAAGGLGGRLSLAQVGPAVPETFEITRTEAEWRAILTQAQFAILRQEATEFPFTNTLFGEQSPLLEEHRVGLFHCAGCDLPVYSSEHKYDSRTGWPSFWQAIDDAVRTKTDFYLGYARTEVHCRRCGGHFGHIFDDGPPPTGKRHCLNGLALTFAAA